MGNVISSLSSNLSSLSSLGLRHGIPLITLAMAPLGVSLFWSGLSASPFLLFFPYVLLTLAATLGLSLNQTRVFFVCLAFGVSFAFLHLDLEVLLRGSFIGTANLKSLSYEYRRPAVALSLPLSLILLLPMGESRLFGKLSAFRILAVLFLPILVWTLLSKVGPGGFPEPFSQPFQDLFQSFWALFPSHSQWQLPQSVLLIIALLVLFTLVFWDSKLGVFYVASLISLLPIYFSLNQWAPRSSVPPHLPISFLAVSLTMLYAVFRIYWQRVYLDELTGISNRRALDEAFLKLAPPYVIAMLDIDHFKKFNDQYGHDQGDHVLRLVARHFMTETGNRTYRYGGEEFAVLLKNSTIADAKDLLDQARDRLAKRKFTIRKKDRAKNRERKLRQKRKPPTTTQTQVKITVSIGLCERSKNHRTPEEVLHGADQALYDAKAAGRNCVRVKSTGSD